MKSIEKQNNLLAIIAFIDVFLRKKASVDRMQTLLPLASFIPPPCRLNNEQQCYLFYSFTAHDISKISLKLFFILLYFELLHQPKNVSRKRGVYKQE